MAGEEKTEVELALKTGENSAAIEALKEGHEDVEEKQEELEEKQEELKTEIGYAERNANDANERISNLENKIEEKIEAVVSAAEEKIETMEEVPAEETETEINTEKGDEEETEQEEHEEKEAAKWYHFIAIILIAGLALFGFHSYSKRNEQEEGE